MTTATKAATPESSNGIDQSPVKFILLKQNKNKHANRYPASVIIPSIDEVYFEEEKDGVMKGRNRVIRYIPGEPSIWRDEQADDIEYRSEPIVIQGGVLILNYREVLLIEFLRTCNYNRDTKFRKPGTLAVFKEFNAEAVADTFLKKEIEENDLKNTILGLDPHELEAYAMVLGDKDASSKKTEVIKRDLLVLLKTDPKRIKDAMSDTNSIRKVTIMKAHAEGIIKCDNERNVIAWSNGEVLKHVPLQRDAVDYMVELSFLPAYSEVLDFIKEKLIPEQEKIKVPEMGGRKADEPEGLLPTTEVVVKEAVEEPAATEEPVVEENKPPAVKSKQQVEDADLKIKIEAFDTGQLYDIAIGAKIIYEDSNSPYTYITGTTKEDSFHTAGIRKKGFGKKCRKNLAFKIFIYNKVLEKGLV